MREVVVGGIGLTKWGFYPAQESYDFGSEAIFNVLEDAEMEWKDIQAAFCGSVYQGTGSGHQAIKEVGRLPLGLLIKQLLLSCTILFLRLVWKRCPEGLYLVQLFARGSSHRGLMFKWRITPINLWNI